MHQDRDCRTLRKERTRCLAGEDSIETNQLDYINIVPSITMLINNAGRCSPRSSEVGLVFGVSRINIVRVVSKRDRSSFVLMQSSSLFRSKLKSDMEQQ